MLYLSRGIYRSSLEKDCGIVNRCGKDYAVQGRSKAAWIAGSRAPISVERNARTEEHDEALLRIKDEGLIATTECEDYVLGAYSLLTQCMIVPMKRYAFLPFRKGAARVWIWLKKAGLKLTMAELCYLFEHDVRPDPTLLGAANRQNLVEKIYTADNIEDGLLEAEMETARQMPSTVSAVLWLLKKGYIAVI